MLVSRMNQRSRNASRGVSLGQTSDFAALPTGTVLAAPADGSEPDASSGADADHNPADSKLGFGHLSLGNLTPPDEDGGAAPGGRSRGHTRSVSRSARRSSRSRRSSKEREKGGDRDKDRERSRKGRSKSTATSKRSSREHSRTRNKSRADFSEHVDSADASAASTMTAAKAAELFRDDHD